MLRDVLRAGPCATRLLSIGNHEDYLLKGLILMASQQPGYGHRHSADLADLALPALAVDQLLRDHQY
jgi:hypothetical protein